MGASAPARGVGWGGLRAAPSGPRRCRRPRPDPARTRARRCVRGSSRGSREAGPRQPRQLAAPRFPLPGRARRGVTLPARRGSSGEAMGRGGADGRPSGAARPRGRGWSAGGQGGLLGRLLQLRRAPPPPAPPPPPRLSAASSSCSLPASAISKAPSPRRRLPPSSLPPSGGAGLGAGRGAPGGPRASPAAGVLPAPRPGSASWCRRAAHASAVRTGCEERISPKTRLQSRVALGAP